MCHHFDRLPLISPIEVGVEPSLHDSVFAILGAVDHPSPVAAHKKAVATAQLQEVAGLDAGRLFTAYSSLGWWEQETASTLVEQGQETNGGQHFWKMGEN